MSPWLPPDNCPFELHQLNTPPFCPRRSVIFRSKLMNDGYFRLAAYPARQDYLFPLPFSRCKGEAWRVQLCRKVTLVEKKQMCSENWHFVTRLKLQIALNSRFPPRYRGTCWSWNGKPNLLPSFQSRKTVFFTPVPHDSPNWKTCRSLSSVPLQLCPHGISASIYLRVLGCSTDAINPSRIHAAPQREAGVSSCNYSKDAWRKLQKTCIRPTGRQSSNCFYGTHL